MFDAIEDIPSEKLVAELLSRRSGDLSTVLVEIADEMRKGDDADIRWLQGHATYVEMGAAILQEFSPAFSKNTDEPKTQLQFQIGDKVIVQECGTHYDDAGQIGVVVRRYATRNSDDELSPTYEVEMPDGYIIYVFEDELIKAHSE